MKISFKSLFVVSLLSIACVVTPVVQAQAPTADEPVTDTTNTKEASGSSSIESIKKIIKDNLNSGLVQGTIDNLLNRRVAMIGKVSRVTGETITLTNRLGTRIIPLTEVISITKSDKDIKITDIAVENWILILGKIKEDNFTPVFIEVSTESLRPKSQFVSIGTVTDISTNSITIIPRSSTDSEKEITLVKNTTYENSNGEAISKSDLTEDITVLITGYTDDNSMEAATIHSLAVIETDE